MRKTAMPMLILLLTLVFASTAFASSESVTIEAVPAGNSNTAAIQAMPVGSDTAVIEAAAAAKNVGITPEIVVGENGAYTVTVGDRTWSFGNTVTEKSSSSIGTVVNVSTHLNIRSGAGTKHSIIGRLKCGDTVNVLGSEGDWYKIETSELTGYVYKNYLNVTEQTVSSTTSESTDEEMQAMLLYLMSRHEQNAKEDGSQNDAEKPDNSGGITIAPIVTEPPTEPLSVDGNLTLVDDIGSTTGAGQQFITVESKAGNTFYLVIDRNDKDAENVHFLNQVDEADLMSLIEKDGEEYVEVCICSDRCEAGAVNMRCPVCKLNMTECEGREKTITPVVTPEPVITTEPEKEGGIGGMVTFVLIALLGGGAALWYFKLRKPKANGKGDVDLDDLDLSDDDEVEYVTEGDDQIEGE